MQVFRWRVNHVIATAEHLLILPIVSFLLSLLPFAMVNIGQAAWAPSIRHGFLPGKVLAKAGTVQTKALGNEKRATCELEQSQFQLR